MTKEKEKRTDIYVVQEARRCPASLAFCLENPEGIWLRYVPRNRPELTNIDLDTSL